MSTIPCMRFATLFFLLSLCLRSAGSAEAPQTLADTEPLEWTGDIPSRMIDGIDRFLLRRLDESKSLRERHWHRDGSSPSAWQTSMEPNRNRLAHILGVRDPRAEFDTLELVATIKRPALLAEFDRFRAYAVRWPVLEGMDAEGVLLVPRRERAVAHIVAIPDADWTPEQICGLQKGVAPVSQFARSLASAGCRVLVPTLIDRRLEARNRRSVMTNREYLYRSSFELGRHIIGYEIQKVLAAVDFFERDKPDAALPIGVVGWGEGAMLTLYGVALDPRIDGACISGYVQPRETIWQEPLDRNVFGLLEQFGDAELLAMAADRNVVVEAARSPEVVIPPGKGGGPGRLTTPSWTDVEAEVSRAGQLVHALKPEQPIALVKSEAGDGPPLTASTLQTWLDRMGVAVEVPTLRDELRSIGDLPDPAVRAERQRDQIDDYNQRLLRESPYVRRAFMKNLKTNSAEEYARTIEPYRTIFRDEVIGRFDMNRLSPRARTRKSHESNRWTGYEVVLDVFPDVFAYGILLLPKDMKPGERRPVVVCQHGLEGRCQDVVEGGERAVRAYHNFAAQLADRGFITFAPQNIYIFGDRFRSLQRKANPLKKTLFSVMVPQHQQITDWLASLPQVDPQRIAFYGLSYGGKSAMRIPALVDRYCLSICSGDFNEWVWKNVSTRSKYSYVWTGEYEIFEFDLGSTFNYSEMAALIAPRPFMVERGHFDGVAPDEMVAYEFAKVRHLYQAQLKLQNRCAIEWFDGPHMINGVGTFEFLDEQLAWPRSSEK